MAANMHLGGIHKENPFGLRIKSFYGDDEKILYEFSAMITRFRIKEMSSLHTTPKEFDFHLFSV